MFVSSARYRELKEQYEVRLSESRSAFESRILELQARIEDLRKMVFSPTQAAPTPTAREADAIITPTDPAIPTEADMAAATEELRERDRLFAGAWDEVS